MGSDAATDDCAQIGNLLQTERAPTYCQGAGMTNAAALLAVGETSPIGTGMPLSGLNGRELCLKAACRECLHDSKARMLPALITCCFDNFFR